MQEVNHVAATETTFDGVRVRFDSDRTVPELYDALLADVGTHPVPINDIAAQHADWASYEHAVEQYVGPHGFMLFATFDHGAWIGKAGIDRRVLRVIVGNPLIAITMLRHDITAGLFAPVELLLTEEDGDRSALTYVRPSSLMVVEPNPPLLEAALALDEKLAAMAESVTAG
ncbi:DUF302 domain-containing protein [Mycobacterium yunnanensis]|uniref:DUF302 domain-containing protein n=1 Tax=Mycobacterium yunnanensis TaxID=368477 RepID=A0A9X2ZBB7_9MYCO|nr:DUF302 domain-containing protein [Mycobacterium yunnanensis]MCV7424695.1 DUF302 domain-containing protein [Mycobacterium yunnanensis]